MLSQEHARLHQRAVDLSCEHRRIELSIVEALEEIDRVKLYKQLGYASLFQYATRALKFTEAVAYSFITVARKAREIPEIMEALRSQALTVAKISRMTSVATPELVEFAKSCTVRELDLKVAALNPKARRRTKATPISETEIHLSLDISLQTYEDLQRAQTLQNKPLAETLQEIATDWLERKDPVRKAKRAEATELCAHRASAKKRTPLTAAEKHAVFRRDKGRCTFTDGSHARCGNEKWLHVHHIVPVNNGGTNHPDNLTTLCSTHHQLVHQLSFAIDGQVNWIRAPRLAYVA